MPGSRAIGIDEAFETLLPQVQQRRMILLAGSGVSVPAGLPTWDQLLDKFIDFCDMVQDTVPLEPSERFDALLDDARTQKHQYPTRVASALKQRLAEIDKKHEANVSSMLRNWLLDLFHDAKPGPNHSAIVATDYPYILTTNYDRLLENAAFAGGFKQLYSNSFTFKDYVKLAGAIHEKRPAIVHLHGDPTSIAIDDFVFTSEDYVRIKRMYSGFTMSMHTLMMSYSTLFVGYGGSDPHLEELVEEFSFHFDYTDSPLLPRSYLLLKKDKAGAILRHYKQKLRTQIISVDDYAETPTFLGRLRDAAPRSTT